MKEKNYKFETITESKRKVMETILRSENVKSMISPQSIVMSKDGNFLGLFEFVPFLDSSEEIVFHLVDHDMAKEVADEIVNEFGAKDPSVKQFTVNVNYENAYGQEFANRLGWIKTHEYDEIMLEEGAEFLSIYKKANPYYECLERKLK